MTPKSKEEFERIRSLSEEKIMGAALELFAKKGFKTTSISDIAKSAEVSKGLMYNYFESKLHLLKRIIERAVNTGKDILTHAIEDFESPKEELQHVVWDSLEHVMNNFEYWKLLTALSFQPDTAQYVQEAAEERATQMFTKGVEIFERLGSPEPIQSAMLFSAALDGIFFQYLHIGESYPLRQMAEKLLNTFLDKNSIHNNLNY